MLVDEVLEAKSAPRLHPEVPAEGMGWGEREQEEEETVDVDDQLLSVDVSGFSSSAGLQLVVDVVDDQVVEASPGWRPRRPRSPREPPWLEISRPSHWGVLGRRSGSSSYSLK